MTCPCCGVGLTPLAPRPSQVECPVCGHRFKLAAADELIALLPPESPASIPDAVVFSPIPSPRRRHRRAVGAAVLLLMVLALSLLWWFLSRPLAPGLGGEGDGVGAGGGGGGAGLPGGAGAAPSPVSSPVSSPVADSGAAVVAASQVSPTDQEVWAAAVARVLKLCKRRGQAKFPDYGAAGTTALRGSDGVYTVEGYFFAPDRTGKMSRVRFEARVHPVPHGFESDLPVFE